MLNGYVGTVGGSTVKIWNVSNNNWNLIRTYSNHTGSLYALEYINEDTLASGATDNTIQIWSINTGVKIISINVGEGVLSLKLLNSSFIACGTYTSGNINIYNIDTGSIISTLLGHVGYVEDLVLINCNLLSSSGQDYTVRIWDLTTYTQKFNLIGH